MKKHFEYKNITSDDRDMIRDVDLKSRTVTGYFSRFNNKDYDDDVIVHGAFTKTIKERGYEGKNMIVHLADHYMSTDNVLAKPKLFELRDGGYFESRFSDTQKANDILTLYRDGVINQHSFGFKTIKSEKKKDYREIQEVAIFEISTVVLGANPETPFMGFKPGDEKSLLKQRESLANQYKTLTSAYHNGGYSDEVFPLLEAQIKQLEQDLAQIAITVPEPERSSTQPESIDIMSLQAAKEELFLNLLNI